MKSLTTYEKIFLGCVTVLAVVLLLFYLGKAVYKWSALESSQKENKNICSPEMNLYPKIYTAMYKGKILYKVEQCRWETVSLDGTTEYSWQIGVEPTEDKDLAIKKYYEYTREFIKRCDDKNIKNLNWLEVDGEGRFLP